MRKRSGVISFFMKKSFVLFASLAMASMAYIIILPLNTPYIIPPISLNCFTIGNSDTASNITFANIKSTLVITKTTTITIICII